MVVRGGFWGLFSVFLAEVGVTPSVSHSHPLTHRFDKLVIEKPVITAVYPHNTTSYTEGFVLYDGDLYESTGCESVTCNENQSQLLRVELKTGRAVQSRSIPNAKAFAEGITVLDNKIFQLTYQSKTGYIYDRQNFALLKSFQFTTDSEQGWGLTTNGSHLIVSDGTNKLYLWDPAKPGVAIKTFKFKDSQGNDLTGLNELEYVGGPDQEVLANLWIEQYYYIVRLSLAKGLMVGLYDFSEIQNEILPNHDVFNGIAYDKSAQAIIITGKYFNATFVASI